MLTAVDHIVIEVADLDRAVATYRNLGFAVEDGRLLEDRALAAQAFFGDFYLEFRSVENRGRAPRVVLRTDDLDAEVARLTSMGLRVNWTGPEAQFDSVIPIALVGNDRPIREELAHHRGTAVHPNTATVLERTYVAVESIEHDLELFEQLLDMPSPEPEMGTVIMSLMSVFYVGEIGIAVAEPRGPGPTADALGANGKGLFQVLFRAEHIDEAARMMVENGLPPPERGTRLSGESALLVTPDNACNLYVAFAGKP